MEKIKLTGTDFITYPLALGTGGYGELVEEQEARWQMSRFLEIGGNFFDTAHVYGGEDSKSEKIIGRWFKDNGHRHDIFLSSKGGHPRFSSMNISRLSEKEITSDLDESLTFLNTDYIDVYFLHRDDESIAVGELLEILESKYKAGKIRNYGCSNWKTKRIKEAADYAAEHKLKGFNFNQVMWSLADINREDMPDKTLVTMDKEMLNYHSETQMNAMAYTSTAKAYFTRMEKGIRHAKSYGVDIEVYYDNEVNKEIFKRLTELCSGDKTMMDYALAFFSVHNFPSVPVAAFSKREQFNQGTELIFKDFDKNILKELSDLKKY